MSSRALIVGLLLVLALIAGWWLSYLAENLGTSVESATVFDEPRPIADFALTDHDNRPFDQRRFEGQWSLVFFGFTNCPGICPMTLSTLGQAVADLPQPPQIVFVSVDPERDDRKTLAQYVGAFGDNFIGVTGPPDALDRMTASFFVTYAMTGDGDDYLVEHTTSVFLVDPQGRLKALFSGPLDAGRLTRDLQRLL